jgi:hypothetical protein
MQHFDWLESVSGMNNVNSFRTIKLGLQLALPREYGSMIKPVFPKFRRVPFVSNEIRCGTVFPWGRNPNSVPPPPTRRLAYTAAPKLGIHPSPIVRLVYLRPVTNRLSDSFLPAGARYH